MPQDLALMTIKNQRMSEYILPHLRYASNNIGSGRFKPCRTKGVDELPLPISQKWQDVCCRGFDSHLQNMSEYIIRYWSGIYPNEKEHRTTLFKDSLDDVMSVINSSHISLCHYCIFYRGRQVATEQGATAR